MLKILQVIFIVLSLTACHERRGPEPETSKLTETIFSANTNVTTEQHTSTTETLVEDIPILEEDQSVIPEPILIEETRPLLSTTKTRQVFRGGITSSKLDIKTIRSSQNDIRTRLVFDTYASNTKATQSGKYLFTYIPSKKQIDAAIFGYSKFSALTTQKMRTFPQDSIIKSITIGKQLESSGYTFNISLKKNATINIFELKEPARIVVDITAN